jgi:hypothetical protein
VVAIYINFVFIISVIDCIGFIVPDLLYVLNAARYSFRLSLHIPLWIDSHGLRIDALFSQLFIWHSPLTHSLSEWFMYSCLYPNLLKLRIMKHSFSLIIESLPTRLIEVSFKTIPISLMTFKFLELHFRTVNTTTPPNSPEKSCRLRLLRLYLKAKHLLFPF